MTGRVTRSFDEFQSLFRKGEIEKLNLLCTDHEWVPVPITDKGGRF